MRVAAREPRVGNLLGVGIAGGATGKRKDAGNERRREARAADLEPVGLPLVPRRVVDCAPVLGSASAETSATPRLVPQPV